MTAYATSPHTGALLQLLRASWELVGDAQAPEGLVYDKGVLTSPYIVLYPLPAGGFDGSLRLDDAQADAWPTCQVTCVGATREQAESMRDKARVAVLGQFLTVPGRHVGPVRLLDEQPTQRDDQRQPPLFYAVDRYRCYSTPTS